MDLLSGTVRATDYAEYDRVVELFGTYPYPRAAGVEDGAFKLAPCCRGSVSVASAISIRLSTSLRRGAHVASQAVTP